MKHSHVIKQVKVIILGWFVFVFVYSHICFILHVSWCRPTPLEFQSVEEFHLATFSSTSNSRKYQKDRDLLCCWENRINYHHNKCLLSSSVGVCVYKCARVLVLLSNEDRISDIWWEDSFTKWEYFGSSPSLCESKMYNFFICAYL